MPKGGKDKKSKKDKKAKAAAAPAAEPAAAPVEKASKQSKSGGRQEIGSEGFMKEVGKLRDANLAKNSKKEDERKATKQDLKQALETCLQLANKGLKMCNTGASAYLLEHIAADAEKLKIHVAQDEDYIEEVRFKHNKLHDLLDESRAFTPQQLQKDLVRNREIRTKCGKLIRGDKEVVDLVNKEEMHELVKIRNSIRVWYGGMNMAKGAVQSDDSEKAMLSSQPTDIKVRAVSTV